MHIRRLRGVALVGSVARVIGRAGKGFKRQSVAALAISVALFANIWIGGLPASAVQPDSTQAPSTAEPQAQGEARPTPSSSPDSSEDGIAPGSVDS